MLPKIDQSKLDDMHYDGNDMLSRNKPFNACISPRELGKTTWFWLYSYRRILKGKTTIVFRYIQADITDVYIEDIEKVHNKFLESPIELKYKRGSIKDGVVDVYIDDILYFRIVAISLPVRRLKSLMLPNLTTIGFDEFIVDTRHGEKYVPDTAFKIKEIYNTFQRESNDLRFIALGNPYSLFNPLFVWWNVPAKELYQGNIYTNDICCVECGKLSDRLRDVILARNPLYKFDDSYKKYAFDGRAVNDEQIKIKEDKPEKYQLRFVFYVERKYLLIWGANFTEDVDDDFYWIEVADEYKSTRRLVTTFNIDTLIEGTYLISRKEKDAFGFLKTMFRYRKISFKDQVASYLFEQVVVNI